MKAIPFFFASLLCGTLVCAARADEKIDAAQFHRDLAAIAQSPSRQIGSPGYESAARYLETEIAKLPNVELRKHDFSVMVPVTQSATIDLGDGSSEKIYPFWPAQIRVNSTPAEGITGKLVYCEDCRYEQIPPASLKGQIAVIEASAGGRWTQAFYTGARAALVLGSANTTWADLCDHDLRIPVDFPRFYVPPGELAEKLRRGAIKQATLKASVTWQRVTAHNYYALVKPPSRLFAGWTGARPPAALMFSVPFDSSSLVPDLSPGASQAVQTASGLALLRDIAAHPWNRPVVVFFSGADSIQFLATRNMFLALSEAPVTWRSEIASIDEQLADVQTQLHRASEVLASPEKLSVRDDRTLIDRISATIQTDLSQEQDKLFRLRSEADLPSADQNRQAIADLENRQVTLNRLNAAFQLKPAQLSDPAMAGPAKEYLARVIARLGGDRGSDGLVKQYNARKAELNGRIDLYHWLADAVGRTGDPDRKQTNTRLIELLVGLDLSDHGSRAGPMFFGYFQRSSGSGLLQEYNEWFYKLDRSFSAGAADAKWWGEIQPVIDLEPLRQLRAPSTYLAGPMPIPSELAPAFVTPGMSMITLDDLRLRRDTPNDTLENLNVDAILPQLAGIKELFQHAWNDPKFRGPVEIKRMNVAMTGQVVSPSSAKPVPDLPRPGFLMTYSYIALKAQFRTIPQLGLSSWAMGVRRSEVQDCDADGNYRFEGLPKLRPEWQEGQDVLQSDMQVLGVMAFRIEPGSGAITATTDLANQIGDTRWSVDIKQPLTPIRSVVFDCEEFSLTGLYDPRYLQTLREILPLDARGNSEPQRYCMLLGDQMMAGFVEPGMPSNLLIRYGRVGNRLVLLNMPRANAGDSTPAPDQALGYTAEQLNNLGPLALATSHDFYELDDHRLDQYRKAGVSSELVDSLHREAGAQILGAEKALAENDDVGLIRDATGAWANEARVYNAAQDMARDVVRAAVFLLLLCVPFAFCMERLLIGTSNIYRQISGAAAIFGVMALALWSFHPAFKISASPLIVILAFAIIFMSLVVIFMVRGKFNAELKRLRSGRGSAHSASLASAGILGSAVLLGIANMRKRKFRTVLTSVTIVLITFAVLCFTSTTHYVGTTTIPLGVASSHPGILLRQRGHRPMPLTLADQIRAVLADPAMKIASSDVVERWWAVSVVEQKEQYHLIAPAAAGGKPKVVAVQAVLGLTTGESKLSRIAEIVGPEKFARLENGEHNVIYIGKTVATQLQAKEGDHVRLGGIDVQIAGVFDERDFDQHVVTLSGEPIGPLKYASKQLDSGGRPIGDDAAESLDVADASEASGVYEHLSSQQFIIAPADLCKMFLHCTLRSVAFRLENQEQVKAVSDGLARRFSLAMFAGYDDGVRLVAASNLSNVSGAGQVAIPLAIAGLIIFNTMMGSIAERRREIHVYTSLGLAPLHVGALFVAEAMVYGLIGTVLGYVIGQGAGTAMQKFGWLGSATLNYSGTSAMLTMSLILVIVLVSALIPARLASKIAAPSIERSWKVPEPLDGRITATLPFTINRTAADGALAYIAEFFDAHRQGSIGKFSAGDVEPFAAPESPESHGLRTDIWLTPFDLGVRQHFKLLIHPGQFPDIYEVEVFLERISGDDGSWHRMNRTFLTELRKQFLQWRSLSPARMMEYVNESKQLFRSVMQSQILIHHGGTEGTEK